MHIILRTDLKEEYFIKCPICGTVLPEGTDFCVYCGTLFDSNTIKRVDKEGNEKISGASN